LEQPPRTDGAAIREKEIVSSRLDHITDWAAVAKSGNNCAARVTPGSRISARQLDRSFEPPLPLVRCGAVLGLNVLLRLPPAMP
jgi:hypothetical protein